MDMRTAIKFNTILATASSGFTGTLMATRILATQAANLIGYEAHAGLWDIALTGAEVLNIGVL